MSEMNQTECINVNFRNETGIFNKSFLHLEKYDKINYNKSLRKVTILVETTLKGFSSERLRKASMNHVPQVI